MIAAAVASRFRFWCGNEFKVRPPLWDLGSNIGYLAILCTPLLVALRAGYQTNLSVAHHYLQSSKAGQRSLETGG